MAETDPAVIKRGNIEDEQTGEGYEVFEFRTVGGKSRQVRIPRANSRNATHIYKELLKLNADLPLLQASGMAAVQQAIDTQVATRLVYAKALGWRQHLKGFTFADGFIGSSRLQRRVLPPLWASEQGLTGLRCKGRLMDWQRMVATPAAASDSLVLALAACFTAPLLKIVNQSNFGFNLFGLTQDDREAAKSVAASVLGLSGDRISAADGNPMPSLEIARAFNDLVVVDDAEASGSTAHHRRWRQGIKALITGRTTPRPKIGVVAWRGIFLTTSENSNEQFAASIGEARTNNERAAWVDVPATKIGSPHDPQSNRRRRAPSRRASEEIERLRAACVAQQGTPIQAYIRFLIKHRTTLHRTISRHRDRFIAAAESRHRAITANFALLYAGGCLAIEAGILPWQPEHLRRVLQRQLAAVILHLRSFRITPQVIRRVLRRRLSSSAVVQASFSASFGPAVRAGFWRKQDDDLIFTVHAKAFRRWFGSPARGRAALLWLHRAGLLLLGDRHGLPSSKTTEWAERTPRWPDGSVQRSFVFKAPASVRRRIEHRVALTDSRRTVRHAPLKPVPLFAGPPIQMRRDMPPKPRGRPPLTKRNPGWEDHPVQPMPSYHVSVGPPPWRDN